MLLAVTQPPTSSDASPPNGFDPLQETLALAGQVGRMVALAETMMASGRPVDLAGLDRSVGLLCAKALDLPPKEGRLIRVELTGLAERVKALSAAVRASL